MLASISSLDRVARNQGCRHGMPGLMEKAAHSKDLLSGEEKGEVPDNLYLKILPEPSNLPFRRNERRGLLVTLPTMSQVTGGVSRG